MEKIRMTRSHTPRTFAAQVLIWLGLIVLTSVGTGCVTTHMEPGLTRPGQGDDPFVSIEAGNVEVDGSRYFARYVVDRATQTCWMMVAGRIAPMNCCDARRAEAVREVVSWEDDASCTRP